MNIVESVSISLRKRYSPLLMPEYLYYYFTDYKSDALAKSLLLMELKQRSCTRYLHSWLVRLLQLEPLTL